MVIDDSDDEVSDISRIKDKAGRYLYVCTWLRDR
jgi:hypothetical protein